MSPPGQGWAGAAYYLPLLVLAAGLTAAVMLLRRWQRTSRSDPPEADPPQLPESQRRALAKAVARLRSEEPG
jgi:hypothetical protein